MSAKAANQSMPMVERAGNKGGRLRLLGAVAVLGVIATVLFSVLFTVDEMLAGSSGHSLERLWQFDVDTLQNSLGNMAQTVAAVLGIVITVVSIVVQLAANRYTPRIADLFFRDRTNLLVLAFFVVACIDTIWISVSVSRQFIPHVSVIVMILLVTASLLVMVPYFAYVFDFLDPDRVVGRIQQQALQAADRALTLAPEQKFSPHQLAALGSVEQLTDISIHAVSQKDKAIASGAVDALRDLLLQYFEQKPRLSAGWFAVRGELLQNPDFVSLSADSIQDLTERRTWLEWKALRQYQSIYLDALGAMPEMNYLLAINTRYLGQAAVTLADTEALNLVVKFMNTYLRATLNARQVRVAYNLLHQYRQLAESLLQPGLPGSTAVEIAGYFRYYGQLAHSMDLGFITETVAYDLAQLCELAFGRRLEAHDGLLRVLLELDKEAENLSQETSLRGVRKAQAKLATFYLLAGDRGQPFVAQIRADMREERPERLLSIRDELLATENRDFWEVIDRGSNFDYVDDARKSQLKDFFAWLDTSASPA